MKTFQLLSRPIPLAMATTRRSMVLLAPRVVGADTVSASPTLTSSFSAWLSKIITVPGCSRSSIFPLMIRSTCLNSGSSRMSMPPMPTCIDPVSEMALAQPRPRWTANSISGRAFLATSIAAR